jgi:hypothetical protein
MKYAYIIILALLLAGCATPTKDVTKYQVVLLPNGTYDSIITERTLEYDNSTYYGGKVFGFQIAYDHTTYSPTVLLRYGRYDSARVRRGQNYFNTFGLKDVSLLRGEGRSLNTVALFDSQYLDEADKLKAIGMSKEAYKMQTSEAVESFKE